MLATVKNNIKPFDFNRAKRLSRDHVAGFDYITQNMAKMLTAYFTTLFRRLVEVRPKKVIEVAYYDFIESRKNPTCLWTLECSASPHSALLEMESPFTFAIIDRLFSGHGINIDTIRPLTHIEQTILTRVIDRVLQIWDQAWRPIFPLITQRIGFENQSYLVQIAGRNDSSVQLSFDVLFEKSHYSVNMCLPFPFLEPMLAKMKDQSWTFLTDKQGKSESKSIILPTVLKTKNDLKVMLGKTKVTIQDYLNLKVDDVLVLDQKIEAPLVMKVADKPCFWVKPGIRKNIKVVKVIKEINEAEDAWILEN